MISKNSLKCNLYADDTQLYISFTPKILLYLLKLTTTFNDILSWMKSNKQVIVGSMYLGYKSDTAGNRTHNLFLPNREPIPLGHSDGQLMDGPTDRITNKPPARRWFVCFSICRSVEPFSQVAIQSITVRPSVRQSVCGYVTCHRSCVRACVRPLLSNLSLWSVRPSVRTSIAI